LGGDRGHRIRHLAQSFRLLHGYIGRRTLRAEAHRPREVTRSRSSDSVSPSVSCSSRTLRVDRGVPTPTLYSTSIRARPPATRSAGPIRSAQAIRSKRSWAEPVAVAVSYSLAA
jgi:hypothetical protein